MAGIVISALPAIVTPALTDIFPVVQSGVTYKSTITQLGTLLVPIAGGTMTGALILNTSNPSTSLQAASKGYVDSVASAFATVFVARLATTANFAYTYANGSSGIGATLTAAAPGAVTMDGVTVALNDLVLFKNQSTPAQNGYYKCTNDGGVTPAVFTRSTNYDEPSEIQPGDVFVITAGSSLAKTSWIQTAVVATVGTDSITFSQYSVSLPVPVTNGGTGLTSTTINQILYSSSNNVIAGLATANNSTLATNGSGVPSMQISTSVGTMVLLQSLTASNSASIAFTGLDATLYTTFVVVFNGVYSTTDNVILTVVNGTGAGPTYNTANYQYVGWVSDTSTISVGVFNSASASYINIWGNVGNTNAGYALNGVMRVNTGKGTADVQNFDVKSFGLTNVGTFTKVDVSGYRNDGTPITALKFAMSSGNIAEGTFHLYGIV